MYCVEQVAFVNFKLTVLKVSFVNTMYCVEQVAFVNFFSLVRNIMYCVEQVAFVNNNP